MQFSQKTLTIAFNLIDISLEETIRQSEFLKHQLSLDLRYRFKDLPASPDIQITIEELEEDTVALRIAHDELNSAINES